jgi:hypothetical protein
MTMTVKELIKILELLPRDAIVYVEADHGQTPEKAHYINFTKCNDLDYYGEDIDWNEEDLEYEEVTAILIS